MIISKSVKCAIFSKNIQFKLNTNCSISSVQTEQELKIGLNRTNEFVCVSEHLANTLKLNSGKKNFSSNF